MTITYRDIASLAALCLFVAVLLMWADLAVAIRAGVAG